MGFVDYHGTKEDRYSEVVDYAKAQQEEDYRRLQDARVGKWLAELTGNGQYAYLHANDAIIKIVAKYRHMVRLKNEIINSNQGNNLADSERLWLDLVIYTITKSIEPYNVNDEKKLVIYNTFYKKVFKTDVITTAENHYQHLYNDKKYQEYFSECYDLVQEKQFWKWFGRVGCDNKDKLMDIVEDYELLLVTLNIYFYYSIRPTDDNWMQWLEIQKKVLDQIREDYRKGNFSEPDYSKLKNPLYVKAKTQEGWVYEPSEQKSKVDSNNTVDVDTSDSIDEPVRIRRPLVDRDLLDSLLEKQEISAYIEACKLIRKCKLPDNIDDLYKEFLLRLPVLQETIDKYKEEYQPDMFAFYDYYIPEVFQVTATYIEYLDVGIDEKILKENEEEIVEAAKKLIIAVNDKIDEIYKFASIQLKAKAKALDSIMSQNGYVDPQLKI